MERIVSPLVALIASFSAAAAENVARPQWAKYFEEQNVRGTFVLFEPANDRYLVLDPARAKQGFLPASTFKIPNALIGLEVGSIGDENEVFHWDGRPQVRPEWERDQTLATARPLPSGKRQSRMATRGRITPRPRMRSPRAPGSTTATKRW